MIPSQFPRDPSHRMNIRFENEMGHGRLIRFVTSCRISVFASMLDRHYCAVCVALPWPLSDGPKPATLSTTLQMQNSSPHEHMCRTATAAKQTRAVSASRLSHSQVAPSSRFPRLACAPCWWSRALRRHCSTEWARQPHMALGEGTQALPPTTSLRTSPSRPRHSTTHGQCAHNGSPAADGAPPDASSRRRHSPPCWGPRAPPA